MIDRVSGPIVREGKDFVVVMVGGIGLKIAVTRSVLQQADRDHALIYTYFLVREDVMALYGFVDEVERALFETLLGVSGVGPRLALTILSVLNREHLQNAVLREEPEVLTRVPGIGKKTAQKIVFELKGKLEDTLGDAPVLISDVDADVVSALTGLGYSIIEAQTALQSLPPDAPQDVETRVFLALQYFAGD
jgi:Holliday junction DNA helicase RuvA